jgi:hypothetical protein
MGVTPLWLLDVDGVLNALVDRLADTPYGADSDWLRFHQCSRTGLLYPIVANRRVLESVRSAHEGGRVEVRWLTTWEVNDDYVALAEALGLPQFEVEARPTEFTPLGMLDHGMWWKLPAVERALERALDRPVLWTDDEVGLRTPAMRWRRHQAEVRPDLMIIAPDLQVGLTPDHLVQIDDFLTGDRKVVTS